MPSENDENEVKSQLNLGEPPQHVLDWAKENIRENPETRDQVLQEFKDMIFERGECTPHRTDDEYLLRFLRCRNFSIEGAHKLIVNYYKFKENNPEFFEGVSLENLEILGHDEIITVPPYREQTGRRILLYRMGEWDPEKITVEEIFQATLVVLELAIMEPRAQIMGGICIFDLGGLTVNQAWYMTPSVANRMIQIMVFNSLQELFQYSLLADMCVIGNWDPESVTITEIFRASIFIMEVGAMEPINQILGGICIWDLEGISLGQLWYLTPSIAYKMMELLTTSFPMKIEAFHIVNQNWLFDMGFNIFKPLITNDKMLERLHIHGSNYEELHKHIDPKYLPKRYGGELDDYNSFNDWHMTVRKDIKALKQLKQLGYSDEEEEAKLDEDIRKALSAPFD